LLTAYQSKDDERHQKAEAKRKKNFEFAEMLPYVMEFIELRKVANSALVSQHFNYGCSLYKYYTDMRDAVPWNVSPVLTLHVHHSAVLIRLRNLFLIYRYCGLTKARWSPL